MKALSNKGSERLGDALGDRLDEGAKLSVISAYFTVFAYGELKEELSKIDSIRFLFNEPTFVKQMDEEKEPREFQIARRSRERGLAGTELELTLRNNLNQRALARECAEWIRSKGTFKSAKQQRSIQQGGTYIIEGPSDQLSAFSGVAADFTQEGLGYEQRPNSFTSITHFEDRTEAAHLMSLFDDVWNNPKIAEDVTEHVAEQIQTLYRENSPEFIYFLTLYHLFHTYMEDSDNTVRSGIKLEDSAIWKKLYDFQRDAVVGAIHKLEKYKGCIIADSVGLGKTFEALAIIKYYQERNEKPKAEPAVKLQCDREKNSRPIALVSTSLR